MQKFDKMKMKGLQDFLYNSDAHDAKIENIRYSYGEDLIKIDLFNPIFNTTMCIIFHEIIIAFAIKGKEYGSRETILSLTAEEDFSYLQNYIPNDCEGLEDSVYLLFQMLSGDELHIVSREVSIEEIRCTP